MSFGGRGGRGGMRGGLKGATWVEDATIKLDVEPSPLFPPRELPVAPDPTPEEQAQVKEYIAFRDMVHSGPLFTKPRKRDIGERRKIYSEDQDNDRYAAKGAADFDPFTGVETYSMRYERKERTIPQLSEQPFNKEFFPKELWPTISGDSGKAVAASINKSIARQSQLSTMTAEERMARIDKIASRMAEAEPEDEAARDEEMEEEELDDDYEGAEGEMGGDYDAEQYFDNGEDEDDGDDGGGGGDDY